MRRETDESTFHDDVRAYDIEAELSRLKFKAKYTNLLRNTLYALVVSAAIAALVATFILPVLKIYGTSMNPTLSEGDIVISVKTQKIKRGDIVCFRYSNRILVKRVIGLPSDVITIDEDGNIFVNGSEEPLEEAYVQHKAYGECDIEYPYTVPENAYFIVGDNRKSSIDSRSTSIGCVSGEEISGKVVFTIWPLKHFGKLE